MSAARDRDDDSDVLIECRDVYKSFGEKKILNGVSFKVRDCVLDNGFWFDTLFYALVGKENKKVDELSFFLDLKSI